MKEYKGSPALDAGLLAARAGGRALRDIALRHTANLGRGARPQRRGQAPGRHLEEEKKTDATLTEIAETVVNQEAA